VRGFVTTPLSLLVFSIESDSLACRHVCTPGTARRQAGHSDSRCAGFAGCDRRYYTHRRDSPDRLHQASLRIGPIAAREGFAAPYNAAIVYNDSRDRDNTTTSHTVSESCRPVELYKEGHCDIALIAVADREMMRNGVLCVLLPFVLLVFTFPNQPG
jgi:hypothetical protein